MQGKILQNNYMERNIRKMFVYKRRAQYHETDQMGIIHHSNYVKWMEEARVRFMDAMGFGYREMEEHGIQSPVVNISVNYKKSFRFDDEADIYVRVAKYTGAALELAYEFRNAVTGEVCTTASSRHGFIRDGRLVSLKKALPELDRKTREYVDKQE